MLLRVICALALVAAAAGYSSTPDSAEGLVPLLLEQNGPAVPRADHSQVQLTYLGRDRVLAFNQWTGEHALWQFERDGLSKCDAFTWPPLSSGRWTALRYTEFTFAGFTHLISLDPRAGTLTLTECDDAAFLPRCRGEPLKCSPLFTHTLSGRGNGRGSHELTYLGQDLLLHYERATGAYELLTLTRCPGGGDNSTTSRCGISGAVAHGSLPAGAHHSYLGGGYILGFLPRAGGYELLKIARPQGGDGAASDGAASAYSMERVGGGTIDLGGSWSSDARRHRLLALHSGLMLDYDKESGEYRLLDLMTPTGVRSGLTDSAALTRAGELLFSTISASAIPTRAGGGCEAFTTSATCLAASAKLGGGCGWCQASGRCVRGDPWGPCRRAACSGAHAACGVWHSTSGVLGAVDPGHASAMTPAAGASAGTVEPLRSIAAASSAAVSIESSNVTRAACAACAGGGMGLNGGAAEALVHCAACAAATSDAAGEGAAVALPLAAKAPSGVAFRLGAFALQTLQLGPCSRLASPLCSTLLQGAVTSVLFASVTSTADSAADATNATEATPLLHFSIGLELSHAASLGEGTAPDPDTLSLAIIVQQPPPGADAEEEGRLVLSSATVSLANGAAPDTPLPSLLSAPLALPPAAFRSFATPVLDKAASGHEATPKAVVAKPIVPLTFDTHELTYLGYDAILDHSPHTGRFVLWQVDGSAAQSAAAPLLTPPLTGSTWRTPFRRFVYLGFDWWLEYAPASGSYSLHRCSHERWRMGLPPLCASLCPADGCGVSADLAGDVKVLYLGHDALLSMHVATGAYAVLRVQRTPAALLSPPPALPTDGALPADDAAEEAGSSGGELRGFLPALAGRDVAYLGNHLLVSLDAAGRDPNFFLLARNASEVWQKRSPLRAALATPPSTSAVLASGGAEHGGRLVGLSGGRLLTVTPKAQSGFSYELLRCEVPDCAAPDCAALGAMAPTSGEVSCVALGAGDIGADGAALAEAARSQDAQLDEARSAADIDSEGGLGVKPLPLRSVVPPSRGLGRRQWLLLDTAPKGGRALLEYDAPSGDVRILSLATSQALPEAPASADSAPLATTASASAFLAAAASTCDAIPLPAASHGAWAFSSHRLSSIGGADVLDVDPSTSQFRVWQCDKAVPATPTESSAAKAAALAAVKASSSSSFGSLPCVAIDHGVWPPLTAHTQAVWLGDALGDAVLLFDSVSGSYEGWPLRRLSGRTMPRPGQQPLSAGVWSALAGRTLLHAGGSTVLAIDAASGTYELLLLDSSAFLQPAKRGSADAPPVLNYGVLASGTLGRPTTAAAADAGLRDLGKPCAFSYHAPTYLGDDLLLSVEPASGAYCVLRLSRERPSLPPLEHVGGGNLRKTPCEHSSCSTCSSEEGCGWCASSNTCMQGNAIGACGGGCREHWTYGYCAELPCSHHSTCSDCLSNDVCGWCASTATCMAGSDAQPLQLVCPGGYQYQACAARVINATTTE